MRIGILANKVIAPNGQPQTICTPSGQGLIITRLTILTTWPQPEAEGYWPAGNTRNQVSLYKGGSKWEGFSRNGAGWVKYNSNKVAGLPVNQPAIKDPERFIIIADNNGFAGRAVYSIFSLNIGQQRLTGHLDAPNFWESLDLQGPITLGDGQSLTITNGHFPFSTYQTGRDISTYTDNTQGRLTRETALTDHRARASHIRVIAYGQEIQ